MSIDLDLYLFIDRLQEGKLEYAEDLYNKYYYIALKYYGKYEDENREKAKKLASEILKEAILEFVKVRKNDDYNISRYIHGKFQHFDGKICQISKRKQLENQAYNKDVDARVKIMIKNQKIINECIEEIYQFYIEYSKFIMGCKDNFSYLDDDFEFCDNLVSKDDLIQETYLHAWKLINNYYDKDDNQIYFSIYFNNNMKNFCVRRMRTIKKVFNFELMPDIQIDYYDEGYYLQDLEEKDIINKIEKELTGNLKEVFKLVFKGYSYKESADILNITRSRAQQINDKVLEIVNRKGSVKK